MAETSIQWCDHSINPLRARNLKTGHVGHFCAKVSQGCKNCYSSKLQSPYLVGLPFVAENREKVELFFEEKAIQEVLRRRKPTKYFWCDMTDMFWEDYPDEWIDRCFAGMALTQQHTHLVLTKRAERLLKYCSDPGRLTRVAQIMAAMDYGEQSMKLVWPLPNVWFGVSVEDQKTADERIPLLLQTPAAIRFVSYEPALGQVDFSAHSIPALWGGGLHWVIVGGESGPGARPFDVQWARNTVEQCRAAGVAVFYKQGGASNACAHDRKGGHFDCFPEDLKVREFPDATR